MMKKLLIAAAACGLILSCNRAEEKNKQDITELRNKPDGYKSNGTYDGITGTLSDDRLPGTDADFFSPDSTGQTTGNGNPKKQAPQQNPAPVTDWDKKIIKSGEIRFEVKDFNAYYKGIREKVKSLGGYIAGEHQEQDEARIHNTLVIKVPAEQFDNAVTRLTEGVDKLEQMNVNSDDVTGEYTDIRARIEARKRIRDRYTSLLAQAKNMEEILHVESSISQVQEEIESATGRAQYLSHASAFSTITLNFYQVLNSKAMAEEEREERTAAGEALHNGWVFMTSLFIGLLNIWPVYLFTGLAYFLYRKFSAARKEAA